MNQAMQTKTPNTWLNGRYGPKKKLPESWKKAQGLIRSAAQRRALERHVKKMRAEWR